MVIRPQIDAARDFRGYAGRIASGVFKPGDAVTVLPSGMTSKIKEIRLGNKVLEKAFPPLSVTLVLEDDVDVSRGDMLVREHNQPTSTQDLDTRLCWLSDEPMNPSARYILRHTCTETKALIKQVHYKLDINTLHRIEEVGQVAMNDIVRVHIRLAAPVLVDNYRENRTTGSFILVDPHSGLTVAAGVLNL
jgi:sulfate adenylyltransferase subunit 1